MKFFRSKKAEYPFGANQEQWDAAQKESKIIFIEEDKAYAKFVDQNSKQATPKKEFA